MSISGLFGVTTAFTSPSPATTPATNSAAKNSLAANSAATAAPATPARGTTNYNFTNITPLQLDSVAQKLVQSGQFSTKQAALVRLSSEPIGLLGPQGQFEHFSAAQQSTLDNTPINAIQMAKDQISELQSRGLTNDPEYGYQAWQGVLSTLQSLQGKPASVNMTA